MGLSIGVVLLLVAVWLYTRADIEKRSLPPQRILSLPVSLSPGTIKIPEFQTNANANYEIDLECQPVLDQKKMQCLLGLAEMGRVIPYAQQSYANFCKDTPGLIDISWELDEMGHAAEIAPAAHYRGNSQDYPSLSGIPRTVIWRQVGTITTLKDRRYSLVLNVNRDASQLNVASPKISVRRPLSEPIDIGVRLKIVVAGILGLVGLVAVIFSVIPSPPSS